MASTSPPTRARVGRTCGSTTISRSRVWPSIPPIRIACSRRCWDIRTGRTRSVASIAQQTAVRHGRGCCTRTNTPVVLKFSSHPTIPTPCTPHCGTRNMARGRTRRSPDPTAGCSRAPMAAPHGSHSRRAFPQPPTDWVALASRSHRATPIASTRLCRRRAAGPCIAPRTPVRVGR